jgi:hypothetical protein
MEAGWERPRLRVRPRGVRSVASSPRGRTRRRGSIYDSRKSRPNNGIEYVWGE